MSKSVVDCKPLKKILMSAATDGGLLVGSNNMSVWRSFKRSQPNISVYLLVEVQRALVTRHRGLVTLIVVVY